ncbi:MAG: hypothetical protein E3J23_07370 [Candidatus Stahlbacteria bacterium]|nr:MAG: hypothetical protein E3J23_07370 [Candidatus Stahlbacteria bacterium]
MFIRRTLPILIAFCIGFAMLIQYFIPHPYSERFYDIVVQQWFITIYAFMFIFAYRSFFSHHIRKVKRRKTGYIFSIIAIASALLMAVGGFATRRGDFFDSLYNYLYAPLQATMFSLLAFFIASAAFRAFRARNVQATLLLVTAVIVMIGRVPLGDYLWRGMPDLIEWIMTVPSMAAMRGIRIGVGLGAVATAMKIILGVERTYMGGT